MSNHRSSFSLRAAFALLFSLQSIFSSVSLAQQRGTSRPPKPPAAQSVTLRDDIATAVNELLKLAPVRGVDNVVTETVTAKQSEKAKPPADDAPLKELIVYWQDRFVDRRAQDPSERVRQRLLDACEERPWLLPRLHNLLPETEDAQNRLFQLYQNESRPDEEKNWKIPLQYFGHF
jgi:hypothetical protein